MKYSRVQLSSVTIESSYTIIDYIPYVYITFL